MTKYQKYPSTRIIKQANVLAKVNKTPYVCLLNTVPHVAYSVTTHIGTMAKLDIIHEQKE